jgi:thioredoxin-like negative regulator of GroEL
MKNITRILFLMACLATAACAEIPNGWGTNYTSASSEAASAKKPVLIFFTASWCGPCKMMIRLTLTNSAVQQALSTMAHVAIDIDEQQDLAAKYSVSAIPTFLILSDSGAEVRRTTGFQTVPDFMQWLTNGVSEAQEAAARRAINEKKIADIDQLIATATPEATRTAATQLFELCADRDDTIVHSSADRLKTLAARDPSALLEGLNDARLAARIQVANVLRDRLGEPFDFDPWAEAPARDKVIQQWRVRLAAKTNLERP